MALLGKTKPMVAEPAKTRSISLPSRTYSEAEFSGAMERVQTAELEREIVNHALNQIHEAETDGRVSPGAKERLVQHYESELTRVDRESAAYKRIVDLYELETARERLLTEFKEQLKDLDSRINQLVPPTPTAPARPRKW